MKLYYNTVTPLLRTTLAKLMKTVEFSPFRLVGGTALSLQLGHRESVDIDLFTDAEYGSVDFWDIHELLNTHSLSAMLSLHQERYPYSHDRKQILKNFTEFEKASNDFNPICLRGKHWEVIMLDLIDERKRLR